MPDKDGKLSEDELAKIRKWLEDKKNPHMGACPWSGHSDWYVIGHVIYPLRYGDKLLYTGPAYPQVMVACTECGYTMYFNATKIGITEWHGRKDHD